MSSLEGSREQQAGDNFLVTAKARFELKTKQLKSASTILKEMKNSQQVVLEGAKMAIKYAKLEADAMAEAMVEREKNKQHVVIFAAKKAVEEAENIQNNAKKEAEDAKLSLNEAQDMYLYGEKFVHVPPEQTYSAQTKSNNGTVSEATCKIMYQCKTKMYQVNSKKKLVEGTLTLEQHTQNENNYRVVGRDDSNRVLVTLGITRGMKVEKNTNSKSAHIITINPFFKKSTRELFNIVTGEDAHYVLYDALRKIVA